MTEQRAGGRRGKRVIRGGGQDPGRESEDGVIVYSIEVVTSSGVMEVNVDATSGALTVDNEDDASDETAEPEDVDNDATR